MLSNFQCYKEGGGVEAFCPPHASLFTKLFKIKQEEGTVKVIIKLSRGTFSNCNKTTVPGIFQPARPKLHVPPPSFNHKVKPKETLSL